MARGKNLMATLAVAGAVVLGIGAGSTPASAQVYGACAPGYYYSAGYCYPYAQSYYPPAYYGYGYGYGAPFFYPTIGLGFGFGGFHGGGFHGGGGHGGGGHGGGFHGGGHH
jgi:hypothetical protein